MNNSTNNNKSTTPERRRLTFPRSKSLSNPKSGTMEPLVPKMSIETVHNNKLKEGTLTKQGAVRKNWKVNSD